MPFRNAWAHEWVVYGRRPIAHEPPVLSVDAILYAVWGS